MLVLRSVVTLGWLLTSCLAECAGDSCRAAPESDGFSTFQRTKRAANVTTDEVLTLEADMLQQADSTFSSIPGTGAQDNKTGDGLEHLAAHLATIYDTLASLKAEVSHLKAVVGAQDVVIKEQAQLLQKHKRQAQHSDDAEHEAALVQQLVSPKQEPRSHELAKRASLAEMMNTFETKAPVWISCSVDWPHVDWNTWGIKLDFGHYACEFGYDILGYRNNYKFFDLNLNAGWMQWPQWVKNLDLFNHIKNLMSGFMSKFTNTILNAPKKFLEQVVCGSSGQGLLLFNTGKTSVLHSSKRHQVRSVLLQTEAEGESEECLESEMGFEVDPAVLFAGLGVLPETLTAQFALCIKNFDQLLSSGLVQGRIDFKFLGLGTQAANVTIPFRQQFIQSTTPAPPTSPTTTTSVTTAPTTTTSVTTTTRRRKRTRRRRRRRSERSKSKSKSKSKLLGISNTSFFEEDASADLEEDDLGDGGFKLVHHEELPASAFLQTFTHDGSGPVMGDSHSGTAAVEKMRRAMRRSPRAELLQSQAAPESDRLNLFTLDFSVAEHAGLKEEGLPGLDLNVFGIKLVIQPFIEDGKVQLRTLLQAGGIVDTTAEIELFDFQGFMEGGFLDCIDRRIKSAVMQVFRKWIDLDLER